MVFNTCSHNCSCQLAVSARFTSRWIRLAGKDIAVAGLRARRCAQILRRRASGSLLHSADQERMFRQCSRFEACAPFALWPRSFDATDKRKTLVSSSTGRKASHDEQDRRCNADSRATYIAAAPNRRANWRKALLSALESATNSGSLIQPLRARRIRFDFCT
jgi:hypothetical protein